MEFPQRWQGGSKKLPFFSSLAAVWGFCCSGMEGKVIKKSSVWRTFYKRAWEVPDLRLSHIQQGDVFLDLDCVNIVPQGIPVDLIPADQVIGV